MKKIAFRVTICLIISIFEANSPYYGNFSLPNVTIEASASTHSVKKKKKLKKKRKTKKNINKIK
ncbi:MAG: hypothetical protein Q4E53_11655 [Eubacteriales bacterium]|nr:hypothetical protein [Eubacteriales bacterium]